MESLWFPQESTNKAVILFHAYTGVPRDLSSLARSLGQAGYGVYLPLFKGHGGSLDQLFAAGPQDWWQDALEAYDFVKGQGYDKIAAMGLSMGGILATKLATQGLPALAGTFCSPVTSRMAQLPGLMETFLAYAKALHGGDLAPDQLAEIQAAASKQMKEVHEFSVQVAKDLDQVTGPFYIAQGGQDKLIDPEASIDLKEGLVNATVDFHWWDQGGHIITIGSTRQAFQESVLNFLNTQDWG